MIEKLENIRINENTKLISLDVKDMFTNITVNKVIKLMNDNNMGEYSVTARNFMLKNKNLNQSLCDIILKDWQSECKKFILTV